MPQPTPERVTARDLAAPWRGARWVCVACARAAWTLGLGLGLGLSGGQAQAQDTGALRIVPSLDVSLTAQDSTYGQAAGATTTGDSGPDLISQLRPGLSMSARSGRFRGTLDYGLNIIHHSRDYGLNSGASQSLQNALNALLSAELVPSRVFVDASANVSQQSISAYGQQSVDGTQINANRTEVTRGSVRPYAKGNLAGLVNYQLSLNADGTHSKDQPQPYSLATGAVLTLSSAAGRTRLGWSATLSDQRSRFSGSSTSENQRGTVNVILAPNPEVTTTLRGGRESYGIPGTYRQSYANWGADVAWTPSPRTSMSASVDKRYYGHSEQILLDHRFQNSTLRFTSNQGTNDTANATGVGQAQTLLQSYFNLPQFVSAQPDPIQREQLVRAFIKAIGLNPDALIGGGYLNSGATLQRRDDLTFTYSARRTNFTVQGYNSSSRRIDSLNVGIDTTAVRQRGVALSVAYRLTPVSNVNASYTQLRTLGTEAQAGTDLKTVSLSWNTQINRYTTAAVNARASKFDGTLNPYRDTSLSASLGLRF